MDYRALFTDADRDLIARMDGGIGVRPSGGHYDRQGKAITFGTWTVLFERFKDYRVVGQTWTLSGAWVSTVWIGIDFMEPPRIFETMAFRDGYDLDSQQYTTEAAAIAGHEAFVTRFGGRHYDGEEGDR